MGFINNVRRIDKVFSLFMYEIRTNTSVDVYRSFSMYTNILRPNRKNFSEDRLSKYIMVVIFFLMQTKLTEV